MGHCPDCDRYVGPYENCPYCGAPMAGRLSMRVVKIAALLLATFGLGSLWFVARRTEAPLISIAEAGAATNLAYVRVEGICTGAPAYDPATGYLSFWIADDTGDIHVASYSAETRVLLDQDKVPALGDQVSVAGSLRVKGDHATLTLNAPQELLVTRAHPEPCTLSELAVDQAFRQVRVRGQIRRVTEPYSGLTLFTLRDKTDTVDVALSADAVAMGGVTPTLTIGQVVDVAAAVSEYGGEPQLVVASGADVSPQADAASLFPHAFVAELSDEDVGRWVRARGTVSEMDPFSAGTRLVLDDGSGTLTVLLWEDLRTAVGEGAPHGQDLAPGCEIEVLGELVHYRGRLELVPGLPNDVRLLAAPVAGSGPTLPPPSATAQGASAVMVTTPTPTAAPVPTAAPSATPTKTHSPTVTAQPTLETSVTSRPGPIPGPSTTPTVALASIGAVDVGRLGQELTVEGEVVEAASFSHGFRFVLDDGRGEIVLLMWHNVYDDCWDRGQINLGARLRATGEVTEYEGQLQIEPGFGGDVKAVTPAVTTAPRRAIASLVPEDAGLRLMIEGEVVRTEGLPSAVKVFLRGTEPDDQGEIAVFIWRNVLDRISSNTGLGTPGSRIGVVGRVQVYRSNLEFVPTLPNDVTVLEIP